MVYAGIQGSYKSFEIALFSNDKILVIHKEKALSASSHFLTVFQNLLDRVKLTLDDLDFLAVDQGPGAFTSLRVIIASVNGISFARKIPLIGIDGLEAITKETLLRHEKSGGDTAVSVVALLNAYNNEVYYSITKNGQKLIASGYEKIDDFLERVAAICSDKPLLFTGNGSALFRDKILTMFQKRIITPFPLLQTGSAEQIGHMGFKKWQKNPEHIFHISPLYLKAQTFAVRNK